VILSVLATHIAKHPSIHAVPKRQHSGNSGVTVNVILVLSCSFLILNKAEWLFYILNWMV
jgi:hypothetical protein